MRPVGTVTVVVKNTITLPTTQSIQTMLDDEVIRAKIYNLEDVIFMYIS